MLAFYCVYIYELIVETICSHKFLIKYNFKIWYNIKLLFINNFTKYSKNPQELNTLALSLW